MKSLIEKWRGYKKLDERINTLDSGKRFINDSLVEITDDTRDLKLPPDKINQLKEWGGLQGNPEFLGAGSKGAAYLFGDKVLKFTSDATEYRAAKAIVGKEHPNVYTIFEARELPPELRRYKHQGYAIVYSYLDYPNKLMVEATKEMHQRSMWSLMTGATGPRLGPYAWRDTFLPEAETLIKQLIKAVSVGDITLSPPANKWNDTIKPKIDSIGDALGWSDLQIYIFTGFWTLNVGLHNSTLSDEVSLLNHAKEVLSDPRTLYFNQLALGLTFLYDNGIIFNDLKTSNVMEKNGQIAIIDIGYARFREET